MIPIPLITEHAVVTPEHTTSYLASGPPDGPLLVLVHGWPALACSTSAGPPCTAPCRLSS